jgi:hypothetical protein
MGRQNRRLLIGQLAFQRHRLELVRLRKQAPKASQLPRRDLDQRTQFGQRGLQVVDPRPHQFQRIGRVVLRQDTVVAVEDQPAVGRTGHQRNAVAFGALDIVFVLHDLQVIRAPQQRDRQQRHEPQAQQMHGIRAGHIGHGMLAEYHTVLEVAQQSKRERPAHPHPMRMMQGTIQHQQQQEIRTQEQANPRPGQGLQPERKQQRHGQIAPASPLVPGDLVHNHQGFSSATTGSNTRTMRSRSSPASGIHSMRR